MFAAASSLMFEFNQASVVVILLDYRLCMSRLHCISKETPKGIIPALAVPVAGVNSYGTVEQ